MYIPYPIYTSLETLEELLSELDFLAEIPLDLELPEAEGRQGGAE